MNERGIRRRIEIELTPGLLERFWAYVAKGEPGDCWPWTASIRAGYGCLKHKGRLFSAHRIAYTIGNGPIPSERIVTHKCDNRLCCNPAHLEAGTPLENAREMHQRLTGPLGRAIGLLAGTMSPEAIAEHLKVSVAVVRRFLKRKVA